MPDTKNGTMSITTSAVRAGTRFTNANRRPRRASCRAYSRGSIHHWCCRASASVGKASPSSAGCGAGFSHPVLQAVHDEGQPRLERRLVIDQREDGMVRAVTETGVRLLLQNTADRE